MEGSEAASPALRGSYEKSWGGRFPYPPWSHPPVIGGVASPPARRTPRGVGFRPLTGLRSPGWPNAPLAPSPTTTTTNPPPSGRGTARLGGIQNIPAGIYLPQTADRSSFFTPRTHAHGPPGHRPDAPPRHPPRTHRHPQTPADARAPRSPPHTEHARRAYARGSVATEAHSCKTDLRRPRSRHLSVPLRLEGDERRRRRWR